MTLPTNQKANKLIEECLLFSKDKNPCVLSISIICTERFFRSSFDRFLEYLAWIFFWLFQDNRIQEVSLGVAQIQLKHWHRLGKIDSFSPSLKNLSYIISFKENYRMVRELLINEGISKESDVIEIARFYNGTPRNYYCVILKYFLSSVENTLANSKGEMSNDQRNR